MKKLLVPIILTIVLVIGGFIGYTFYYSGATQLGAYQKEAKNNQVKIILSALYVAATVTYAESGHYPKTFKEIGFAPTGNSDVIIKYKSLNKAFTASAVHKETGFAMSLEPGKKEPVTGDLLKEDPEAVVYSE